MRSKCYFMILLMSVLLVQTSRSQIPQTISYQGVLTDAGGNVAPDGNYQINFALYEAAVGGVEIWFERQPVAVSDGLFNVILGSANPLNLPFDKPYWLGISIGSGQVQELTPRIELTASPYSLKAQTIVDNAVTSVKIANGAVTLSKIDTTGASPKQVLSYTGGEVRWTVRLQRCLSVSNSYRFFFRSKESCFRQIKISLDYS